MHGRIRDGRWAMGSGSGMVGLIWIGRASSIQLAGAGWIWQRKTGLWRGQQREGASTQTLTGTGTLPRAPLAAQRQVLLPAQCSPTVGSVVYAFRHAVGFPRQISDGKCSFSGYSPRHSSVLLYTAGAIPRYPLGTATEPRVQSTATQTRPSLFSVPPDQLLKAARLTLHSIRSVISRLSHNDPQPHHICNLMMAFCISWPLTVNPHAPSCRYFKYMPQELSKLTTQILFLL